MVAGEAKKETEKNVMVEPHRHEGVFDVARRMLLSQRIWSLKNLCVDRTESLFQRE